MERTSAPHRNVALLSTSPGRWSRRGREVLLGKEDLPKSASWQIAPGTDVGMDFSREYEKVHPAARQFWQENWLHHMIFNELKLSNFCIYRGEHEFSLAPAANRGKANRSSCLTG